MQAGLYLITPDEPDTERLVARVAPLLPFAELLQYRNKQADPALRGVLDGVSGKGLLGHRLAECKAKDLLDAWVRHLVLNVLRPEGATLLTRWFLQDKLLTFSPVPEPDLPLAALLELYWSGLQRPLHLFPESACAYMKKERSMDAACKVWFSNRSRGEDADPYYRLAFRGVDALDDEFEALAQAVFGPLLAAMEESRPA